MYLWQLTDRQRDIICNGCGPHGWKLLPQWHSRQSCNQHDLDYWVGGTEGDRNRADARLKANMMADAATRPWWQRPWYQLQAQMYGAAVAYNGKRFFYYADQRTKADLP